MFRVNPTTGDAGPCRALSGKCPFGGANEHFTSIEGAEKAVTRVTFRGEDNHELVWWASKHIEVEEDEVVKVKSGKIKKLGSYNGVDQTTLKNVRLEGF